MLPIPMDISAFDCIVSLDDSKADRRVVAVVVVKRVAAAGRPTVERFAANPNDVGRLVVVGAYLLAAKPSADRLAASPPTKVRVDAAGLLAAAVVAGRLAAPNADGFSSLP